MALLNYAYQLDIRDSNGLPLSGLANVELRTASLSYAFTGLGNGVYRRGSMPAGRYMLWINGVSSGQSYAVGAGELAGLGYVDGSYLACETNEIKWEPKPEYVGASHLTDPDAHAELFLANSEASTLETALQISQHEAKTDPHPQYLRKDGVEYVYFIPQDLIPAWQEGKVFFDLNTHTLCVYDDIAGTTLNVGVEVRMRVRNRSGATILNGRAVYIDGATGQTPTIQLASVLTQDARCVIGIMTHDILDQGHGWATVIGSVSELDTSTLTEGAAVFLSATPGILTSTKNPYGKAVQIGVCLYAHGTQGKVLVRVGDATEYSLKESDTLSKERTGFIDGNNIAFLYNETARTVTLTGDLSYLWRGERKELTSPWTSPAHSSTLNVEYFLQSTNGIDFVWGTAGFDYANPMAAYVHYWTNDKFAIQETHGCAMSHASHQHGHDTAGTYRKSGGSLSAGSYLLAPASPTDAGNRPGVDATELWDEDKKTVVPALADNGPYTQLYGNASNVSVFTKDALNIVPIGTTYPQYNLNGVLTELGTNKFMNVYRISVPVCPGAQSAKYGVLWVPGTGSYSSLGEAQSETLVLNLGAISSLAPEYTECQRITIYTSAAHTTVGKFRIEAVTEIGGTKQAPYAVGGTGVTSHWSLSNVQGGAPSDHWHLTQVQHTDLTDAGDSALHYHATDRSRANHTGTQLASTISNFASTVLGTLLTGLTAGTDTVILATNSILTALQNLQAQVSNRAALIHASRHSVGGADAVTIDTAQISNMSAFMRTVNDDATAADARATLGAAPISHASNATTYGVGSSTEYGHVKVDTVPTDGSSNAVSSNAVFDGLALKQDYESNQTGWSQYSNATAGEVYLNCGYFTISDSSDSSGLAVWEIECFYSGSSGAASMFRAVVTGEMRYTGSGSVTRRASALGDFATDSLKWQYDVGGGLAYLTAIARVPAYGIVRWRRLQGVNAVGYASGGTLITPSGTALSLLSNAPTAPAAEDSQAIANTAWVRDRFDDTTVGNSDKVDGMHVTTVNLADKGTDSTYYYFCV